MVSKSRGRDLETTICWREEDKVRIIPKFCIKIFGNFSKFSVPPKGGSTNTILSGADGVLKKWHFWASGYESLEANEISEKKFLRRFILAPLLSRPEQV